MQQQFITSKGKVVIERDVLYIHNIKLEAIFFFNILQILFICAWLLTEIIGVKDDLQAVVQSIGGTFFLLNIFNIVPFTRFIFKTCFSNRIPLQRILNYEIKEDKNDLENEVILYLQSGRYKSILFRKLEKEDIRFLEAISQRIAQPQAA